MRGSAAILAALGLAALAVLAVPACKKNAPSATSAPGDAGGAADEAFGMEAEPAPEPPVDLDELTSELDRLDAELTAAGLGPEGLPQAATPDEGRARCERICELTAATCDLESRICSLADEHAGEDRYASACARAGDRCDEASEACRACSA